MWYNISVSAQALNTGRMVEEKNMPQLGVWELLIVLVIVLLIFGATRLKDIGKGLGGAVTAFRTEVKQDTDEEEKDES
jgi:sec-independent protein translocase protein TatA